MTDQHTEPLNGKYKQAYEFAMNDHLQAKQDAGRARRIRGQARHAAQIT